MGSRFTATPSRAQRWRVTWVSVSPLASRRVRSRCVARSRSPRRNQVSAPRASSPAMQDQVSSRQPQPVSSLTTPASVYMSVSRSGEIARPRCVKSSPVFAMIVSCSGLRARGTGRARTWRRRRRRTGRRSAAGPPRRLTGTGPRRAGAARCGPSGRVSSGSAPPRISTSGVPSAASPITSTAAAARLSATATSLTCSCRPKRSRWPRRSFSASTPAQPMAVPTVPRRQARPMLSVTITPSGTPKSDCRRCAQPRGRRVGIHGQQQRGVVAALRGWSGRCRRWPGSRPCCAR